MAKESSRCFLLHILMDFISYRYVFGLFDLVISTVCRHYAKYTIIFSMLFSFYFSLETLINRFVVRVRHQKYFGEIKSSYRHIFLILSCTNTSNSKRCWKKKKKKKILYKMK